jgi:ABC-type multidrug transport system ATPase subunit
MTLELDSCTFAYGRGKPPVLQDFSYLLPDGLTVLLGPNGAGKSTMLKLAASATVPKSGAVRFGRTEGGSKAYRSKVAWMPQNITAMPTLTAREYVSYVGWLKGMNRTEAWTEAGRALNRVELGDKADARTSQLSGGQLRRVGVAGALVHRAQVLLLDEPTAGMDPRQRRVFRDVLNSLTGDIRVLLSTHDVADLAEEADHVTVMYEGRVVHTGTTGSFLARMPSGTAPGRAAEAAYDSVLSAYGVDC